MPNSEYWISALEPESASVAPTVKMPLLVGMSSGKEALYTAWQNTQEQSKTTESENKRKVLLKTRESPFDYCALSISRDNKCSHYPG